METVLFKDLIKNGIKNVYIRSYGYTEASIFGGTWQPFGNKARLIKFTIDEDVFLYNPTFWIEDNPEPNDVFELKDNKFISKMDYDLCCRTQCD